MAWLALSNGLIVAVGMAVLESGNAGLGYLIAYGIPLARLVSRFFFKGYYLFGRPPSESIGVTDELSRWVNWNHRRISFVTCVLIDLSCLGLFWYPR